MMNNLGQLLKNYIQNSQYDKNAIRMLNFYESNENCFSQDNPHGHFTGSAWVINPEKDQVLMTHHKKLNMWLQLGGHADGDKDLISVASAAAKEVNKTSIVEAIVDELSEEIKNSKLF